MFRRAATVGLSAALAIGLVACGSDAKKGAAPTTTTAPGATTTKAPAEITTTSAAATTTTGNAPLNTTATTNDTTTETTAPTDAPPVDNETFAQLIDEAQSRLNAATGACDLRVIMDSIDDIPDPSTTGQVKLAVEFLVPLYNAIADSVPPAQAKNAAAIRALAKKSQEIAENSNYDPVAFGDDKSTVSIPGIIEAFTAFVESTNGCPGVKNP